MDRQDRRIISAALAAAMAMTSVAGASAPLLAADEPAYYLPAPAGSELIVSQGNSEPAFRSDDETYALDFVAAQGRSRFPVAAARGGTVIAVRSGIKGGRCKDPGDGSRPACWRQVNLILIDHGDGTSGLYLHLRPGRAPVSSGDVVTAGQPIGTAGNTGWTDEIGLQFQVQRTPTWDEQGSSGWFLTESQPVSFGDPDVLSQRPDGVPQAGDLLISGNPGPIREPFRLRRRPLGLPATVPFEIDVDREISAAYEADSPDGYGVQFAPVVELPVIAPPDVVLGDPVDLPPDLADLLATGLIDAGTIVRPLFGGELAFAGCASGASASLGRTVAISFEVAGQTYTAVLGHLSEIEPSLLDLDPAAAPLIIGSNEFLGRYGVIPPPEQEPALQCSAADPTADELFATILRGATITSEGEIIGGTPVSPEPLVGALAYEGLAWWTGPLTATAIADEPGRPRAGWNKRTPAHASHVTYGDPIALVARVRDVTDITEVRFRAYYPAWPRTAASSRLDSFDPTTAWRQLAVCTAPAGRADTSASPCRWNGSRQDAIVTFEWDPLLAPPEPSAPWLPRARQAMTRETTECVPVSLAVEVVDGAGHVFSEVGRLPLPGECDEPAIERDPIGRVLYLDPLVPPTAPVLLSSPNWRWFKQPAFLEEPDPDGGFVRWRDRADNEDGYRVYARRNFFDAACNIVEGPLVAIDTLPADAKRYEPRHASVIRSTPVDLPDAPGTLTAYQLFVAAFNEAGESRRTYMGSFLKEDGFICDTGLVLPPDGLPLPDVGTAP